MADFTTIVARTGYADQIQTRLQDASWNGAQAEDEAAAIELATEEFEQSASQSNWELGLETVFAYEMTDATGEVIGWNVDADGVPITEEY